MLSVRPDFTVVFTTPASGRTPGLLVEVGRLRPAPSPGPKQHWAYQATTPFVYTPAELSEIALLCRLKDPRE